MKEKHIHNIIITKLIIVKLTQNEWKNLRNMSKNLTNDNCQNE